MMCDGYSHGALAATTSFLCLILKLVLVYYIGQLVLMTI